MFSLYLTIALLYLLTFLVIAISICAIAQLPMGIHSSETVAQRLFTIFQEWFRIFLLIKKIVIQKTIPISAKTSPHN